MAAPVAIVNIHQALMPNIQCRRGISQALSHHVLRKTKLASIFSPDRAHLGVADYVTTPFPTKNHPFQPCKLAQFTVCWGASEWLCRKVNDAASAGVMFLLRGGFEKLARMWCSHKIWKIKRLSDGGHVTCLVFWEGWNFLPLFEQMNTAFTSSQRVQP